MLVYQNQNHDVCITSGNLPVENPEYVLKMVDGMLVCTGDDAGDAAALAEVTASKDAAIARAEKAEADLATANAEIARLEKELEALQNVEE